MPPGPQNAHPVRGALLMCAAAVSFSLMSGLIRLVSAELHAFEIAFFRNLFGLIVMLPWLARTGTRALATDYPGLYLWRALLGTAAMLSFFWALTVLPLAEAISLSFTAPLFLAVGAAVFLGEPVRIRRWTATIIGFLGTLIILRPGFQAISPAAMITIASAAFMAASALIIKTLSRHDPPNTIVIYMVLIMTPLSLVPALFVWQWPSLTTWGLLFLLGSAGTMGHMFFTRSYRIAEVTAVTPFDFVRLPVVAIIGYFAFGDPFDLYTWVGATVIFGASVYIVHREAQLARLEKAWEETGQREGYVSRT